ncbi:class I SAM-dependent methyltransferase [uncultured Brachyspira sp.]|uniref:class I SAM-dependent methyltransferase n=1 Tax=uncultured Brachyspira sp. TaxID=221953 RepID=UPI002605226F|nr:class I SAM-dependent methyltransferase [uncultured Brachyspira sp.]
MNNIFNNEEKFHDEWAKSEKIDSILVDDNFESCVVPEKKFVMSNLGDIKDKKLLDIGCGLGESSVYFAKKGAEVYASDISMEMLRKTLELADIHNVKLNVLKSTSDKIDIEDEYFDIVYAGDILHHVDIDDTLKEIKRILKKDGIFICIEPLAHNPAINIFRLLSPKVRTKDEHPLKMKDVKLFNKYFKNVKYDMFWFITNYIFFKYYFFDKVDPNKERYWKKIIEDANNVEKLYYKLENVDNFIKKVFPFIKSWFRYIVIVGNNRIDL